MFLGRREDVPQLMAAADIFAMPSLEEPFGLVYLEAMAMERPVVGLDSGGTPEVVEDGRTGLLASPGDTAGLAARLVELVRDPARRRAMGQYGRQQVDERFTIDRMGSDVGRVYELVSLRCTPGDGAELEAGHLLVNGAGHAGAIGR